MAPQFSKISISDEIIGTIGVIYLKFGVHEELIEGLTGGPILLVILTGVGGPGVLFGKKV